MDALVKLPGVGRKTANVVLGHALGVPGLPVDRHVLRVANRIGLVHSDDRGRGRGGARAPLLPPERWTRASDTLILHGRRVCRPKPLCDRCLVAQRLRVLPGARREGRGRARRATRDATMTRDEFRELVDEALGDDSAELSRRPAEHRDRRRRRAVTPSSSSEVGIEPPDTLLGLYEGTPLTERQWAHGNTLPDKITLFQRPIEDASDDEDDVVVAIGETLDSRDRPLLRPCPKKRSKRSRSSTGAATHDDADE